MKHLGLSPSNHPINMCRQHNSKMFGGLMSQEWDAIGYPAWVAVGFNVGHLITNIMTLLPLGEQIRLLGHNRRTSFLRGT